MCKKALVLVWLPLAALSVQAANWYVDPVNTGTNTFNDIQSAVDAASAGDTVWVNDGTYVLTNQIRVTSAITIQSVNGRSAAIVDGNHAVRCFNLGTNACTLSGFTIRNGYAMASSGNVEDTTYAGGGVWCGSRTPRMVDCTVTGNQATKGGGCFWGTLVDCVISNNTAHTADQSIWSGWGGGVAESELFDCLITDNVAGSGGGAWAYASDSGIGVGVVVLHQCVICSNTATAFNGGGVYAGILEGCVLYNNQASSKGAAVYNGTIRTGGALSMINCLVYGNGSGASAVHLMCGNGGLINCTVANNDGVGVFVDASSIYGNVVRNCVIWGNGTNIENYDCPIENTCSSPLVAGEGNTAKDPLFVNAVAGDFRLQSASPCIDAGANDACETFDGVFSNTTPQEAGVELIETGLVEDVAQAPRVLKGGVRTVATVDMGCYETISADADTDGDGLDDEFEYSTTGTSLVDSDDDGDGASDYDEYMAATDPLDSGDLFSITAISDRTVWFQSSADRVYTLQWRPEISSLNPYWGTVLQQVRVPGTGGLMSLTDPYDDISCFYRVQVELP